MPQKFASFPANCAKLLLALLPLSLSGQAAELKVLVDTSTEMPMAEMHGDQLLGGVHRDLGIALAKLLGREAHFVLMPRKRIRMMLERGEGDLSCHYRPAWLPGDFDWTIPFMPNAVLLISNARAARPSGVAALGNVPIGTVLGYSYPEVEQALGTRFLREDAPDATHNLRKLAAGRMQHALVGELFLHYQQSTGAFSMPIHPPFVVQRYQAQCAVSRRGQVRVSEINQAIETLMRNKQLAAIYERYR